MIRIRRNEFKIGRRPAVVSTVQLNNGWHETMVMYGSGREIECFRNPTFVEADRCHDRMVAKYIA